MSARAALPNRRRQESVDFLHGGIGFTASIGRYADGRVGEAFLSCSRTTTNIESVGRDAAIILSIAIQHGASIKVIRDALTKDEDGHPASVIGALLAIVERMDRV